MMHAAASLVDVTRNRLLEGWAKSRGSDGDGLCLVMALTEAAGGEFLDIAEADRLYADSAPFQIANDAIGAALAAILFRNGPLPRQAKEGDRHALWILNDRRETTISMVIDACETAAFTLRTQSMPLAEQVSISG